MHLTCRPFIDTCAVRLFGKLPVRNGQSKTRSHKPGLRDFQQGTGNAAYWGLPVNRSGERWKSGQSLARCRRGVKDAHHIKISVTEQEVVHPKSRLPTPSRGRSP